MAKPARITGSSLIADAASVPPAPQIPPTEPTATAAASARSPAHPTIDDLLRRMQAGDRGAAAEFLLRYESRIRRRLQGKIGTDVRRLFDSLDIVSTLGRRLDVYVMSGQLKVASESQCLALLMKMADRALIDKARIYRQLDELEGEDSMLARQLSSRLREAERRSKLEDEIENCMSALRDPMDKRILSLWLTGEKHSSIAEFVNMAPTAVRKRWEQIKAELRARLQPALP